MYILDKLAVRSSEGENVQELLSKLREKAAITDLDALINRLWQDGSYEVKAVTYEPYLRYYHYEQEDGHILMLVNEAPSGEIETEIEIPFGKEGYQYDAFENIAEKLSGDDWNDGRLKIKLNAYESALYCWPALQKELYSGETVTVKEKGKENAAASFRIESPFNVSFARAGEGDNFSEEMILEKLIPVQQIEGKELFAGTIRYKTTFHLKAKKKTQITLDTVYEGARVSVNGSEKKVRICPPYTFDVSEAVQVGGNSLVIEVTTTLVREQKDWLSQFMLMEPIGITEAVIVRQF